MRGFLQSAGALMLGTALVAGLGWALLNVPESNVLALTLSAILVLLIVVTAGIITATATALGGSDSPTTVGRRAVSALPGFFAGLVVFSAIWWLTGVVDSWWRLHHGQIDAVFLRYLGMTKTAPLHQTVAWALWLVRWVLGLSIIVALTAVVTRRGLPSAIDGLRLSVRFGPLAAAAMGVLIVSQGFWRLVFWRPPSLPASSAEIVFAAIKLGTLGIATVFVATLVVRIYGRRAA